MDEARVITVLLSLVATFFGLLVLVFGWLGNKVYSKLSEMAATMRHIQTDLHDRIYSLDLRVTVLETRLDDTGGHFSSLTPSLTPSCTTTAPASD